MEIIAHRGASHDAPENTLAAARLAWEQGADALEVDVHLTRDGRLAVIHDSDTNRTAGIERLVADATLAELQQLDVGSWKHTRFAGEKIPVLDEVLANMPRGKRIFVEIKGGAEVAGALARCISDAQQRHSLQPAQIVIISFHLPAAKAAKRALSRVEAGWIVDCGPDAVVTTLDEAANLARTAGLDALDVAADWPMNKALVQRMREQELRSYVWTVDDPTVAQALVAAGVDGITTNRPGWLRSRMAAS